ncbi:MAG: phosphatidylinositol-specific phospholipase C, partial [Deltaproteobacteria bacterium]|nr:phosphatidylinositol-specific phospholipase C [Deltaproteobacteria bacterium]
MGSLNGDLSLSRLSIPGTHNSGALHEDWPDTAQTQDLSIPDQLNIGIRFLDIRCRHVDNLFAIHHGSVYQELNFNDVLNMVFTFLNNNPTECVTMSVKEEYDPSGNTRTFEETFDAYVNQNPAGWYLGDTVPTLSQAKGKILLMRRFEAVAPPKGITAADGWQGNTTFWINNPASPLRIQDNYNVSSTGAKWNTIVSLFNEAALGDPGALYLNFTSGYTEGLFGIP